MTNAEPIPTSAPQASRAAAAGRATFDIALRLGGLFVAIILVAVAFYFINSAFLNIDVIISVLRSMSSVAIMALGLTLVIVVGEIDLSFGAMYGLAANSLAVIWILGGVPVYIAIPIAIGIGALVVGFNGVLTTSLKIPSFIVTLGSYNLLYGLSLYVTNAGTFNPVYPPDGYPVSPAQLNFFTNLTMQFGSHQFSAEVFWMIGLQFAAGTLMIAWAVARFRAACRNHEGEGGYDIARSPRWLRWRLRSRRDAHLLERVSDAQRHTLLPRRRDDLHADRQRRERDRHRHDRQADE